MRYNENWESYGGTHEVKDTIGHACMDQVRPGGGPPPCCWLPALAAGARHRLVERGACPLKGRALAAGRPARRRALNGPPTPLHLSAPHPVPPRRSR